MPQLEGELTLRASNAQAGVASVFDSACEERPHRPAVWAQPPGRRSAASPTTGRQATGLQLDPNILAGGRGAPSAAVWAQPPELRSAGKVQPRADKPRVGSWTGQASPPMKICNEGITKHSICIHMHEYAFTCNTKYARKMQTYAL